MKKLIFEFLKNALSMDFTFESGNKFDPDNVAMMAIEVGNEIDPAVLIDCLMNENIIIGGRFIEEDMMEISKIEMDDIFKHDIIFIVMLKKGRYKLNLYCLIEERNNLKGFDICLN